ncbi:MAG TPA: hypothetical protein VNZ64_08650 [Candidatus Acidoferrum sp.]|nr:hypothetical protein [Candidatus Acidoferrum sp.]
MKGKIILALFVVIVVTGLMIYNHSKPLSPALQPAWTPSAERTVTPRLPAPGITEAVPPAESSEDLKVTNLFTRLINGDAPKLSPEQLEGYLKQNGRNAESLLAAFRTSGDKAYLKEAEEKFPNDPRVEYAAVFKSDSPAERSQWVERLKQSAPGNALPNYLAALDAFKSGQMDQAVQELTAASSKQQFQDYTRDFLQNAEEAYRAAGYSEAEAKTIAATQLLLPDLSELRQLGRDIVGLATSYRQAGDAASADAALQLQTGLGQRFGGFPGEPLISQLVGIAIERDALGAMDPNSSLGGAGQTVQSRLDELNQSRKNLKELGQQETGLFEKMSEQDIISYWDRWKAFGSEATLRWAINKYGQQPVVSQQ